eukprot:89428-Prorocentrum_minimum.AAC.1
MILECMCWCKSRHFIRNVQGTFREHSGNIQGSFREHSGNIQVFSPSATGTHRGDCVVLTDDALLMDDGLKMKQSRPLVALHLRG